MLTLILLLAYFVSFTDKPTNTTPALSPRAVEQREKWNIQIDNLDFPVSTLYMDSLLKSGVTKIYHTSRWFNGVTCEMTIENAENIKQLDFVKNIEITRDDSPAGIFYAKRKMPVKKADENWTDDQLALYNLLPLHEAGFEGQDILMTVCDGGFYKANTLDCFRQEDLELGHFDFTDDTDDFYGITGAHGTECLSVITGIKDGFYGAAARAKYYLMRSEENDTESPKEMDNLIAALETSDSLGVNVFSVSLGYAIFDNNDWTLPKSALDGKTTRVSRAATIAARKGMLVCAAAGNEGDKNWKTICAPADADSILTVGAVSREGEIGSFSSYGPSADGRVKPDVCAVGVNAAVISPDGFSMFANGTSFATPLLAGMAAAIWSALPNENAMQIRERIIRSADRYNNPSKDRYGYGIPDAWKAYKMGSEGLETQNTDRAHKILREGQILILRGGKTYNLSGQLVE
ncbi:MAG: S8 family serine peptidase [Paludibacteraceae bacterium]|nr:S8 family serine peptidase [Paludibacteraceae bacterium]